MSEGTAPAGQASGAEGMESLPDAPRSAKLDTLVSQEPPTAEAISRHWEARARELEAANRRMDDFLRIASHEFKTPVTSMKASVQLAIRAARSLNSLALPGAAAAPLQRTLDLLRSADQQATKLGRLIDDLLDVTRLQAGTADLRVAPADLRTVVHEAVEQQRLAWPGREIRLDQQSLLALPATVRALPMDADRISQVIANFLTNALKYSDTDAPVTVSVSMHEGNESDPTGDQEDLEPDQDHPPARERGRQQVCVAVTDRGPGLTRAQLTPLWQLYQRVPGIRQQSGSGAGLGIGLYVCKTIIEQHQGRVGVESAPGEGSTFWFTLPTSTSSVSEL